MRNVEKLKKVRKLADKRKFNVFKFNSKVIAGRKPNKELSIETTANNRKGDVVLWC